MIEAAEGIGSKIRSRRLALRMTQEELGAKVNKSKATINKYETGIVSNLARDVIEALANALETTPGYLCGWTEQQNVDLVTELKTEEEKKPSKLDPFTLNVLDIIELNKTPAEKAFDRDLEEIDNIYTFDQTERELVTIFNSLSIKNRTKLLMTAYELQESN